MEYKNVYVDGVMSDITVEDNVTLTAVWEDETPSEPDVTVTPDVVDGKATVDADDLAEVGEDTDTVEISSDAETVELSPEAVEKLKDAGAETTIENTEADAAVTLPAEVLENVTGTLVINVKETTVDESPDATKPVVAWAYEVTVEVEGDESAAKTEGLNDLITIELGSVTLKTDETTGLVTDKVMSDKPDEFTQVADAESAQSGNYVYEDGKLTLYTNHLTKFMGLTDAEPQEDVPTFGNVTKSGNTVSVEINNANAEGNFSVVYNFGNFDKQVVVPVSVPINGTESVQTLKFGLSAGATLAELRIVEGDVDPSDGTAVTAAQKGSTLNLLNNG